MRKVETGLLAANAAHKTFRSRERVLKVTRFGHYLIGRLEVLQGRNTFIQRDQDSGELSIGTLLPKKELASCNYFALDTNSWHGLYQHYSHSSSMRDFCDLLLAFVKPEVQKSLSRALKAAGGRHKITGDHLKRIQERHIFVWHALFTRDKLEKLLMGLDRLNEVFYEVSTVKPSETAYGPLAHDLKAEVHRLKVVSEATVSNSVGKRGLVDRVVAFFDWIKRKRDGDIEKSGVVGTRGKLSKTIRIGDIIEQFGEDGVDDVLTHAELSIQDLRTSSLVRRMVDLMEDHEEYFGKAARQ